MVTQSYSSSEEMPDLNELKAEIHELRLEMTKLRERSISQRVWEAFFKIAVPLSFLLGATVIAHEVRLSKIEESRFSAVDGEKLQREILAQARAADAEIAARFAEALTNYPPDWLTTMVDELRQSNNKLGERMTRLETILERLSQDE